MPNETTQPANSKITRMTELRHRRKIRHVRNIILAVLAVVLLVVYASGIYGRGLAMLSDLADSALIGLRPGQGYPIKTGIAEPLQVESLGGGFVELGSKELVAFSARGSQLRNIAHNYARPAISSGNNRFVLYNRSGNELRVESRSRTLYTRTYQQPLITAEMASNGTFAVVTGSSRYMAEVTVYDSTFETLYEWYPTEREGMPGCVSFAPDNRRFAVACLKAENGILVSNIYLLNTQKDEIVSSIHVSGGHVLQMHWIGKDNLLVLFNNHAAVYNAQTGEEKVTYSYGGKNLQSASVSGQNTALLFQAELADAPATLVILDPEMQILGTGSVPAPASGVVCTRTNAYVLRESAVAAYDLTGAFQWEMRVDSAPQAIVNAKKLLVFEGGNVREVKQPAESSAK